MPGSLVLTVPLDEDILRVLGKDVSKLIPNGDDFAGTSAETVKQLEGVVDCLLQTAALVNISAAHRAAACNSLCAVIERCQLSTDEGIHGIIWEDSLWTRLFEIFLERFDNAKAKSMRQVLVVLTGMLLKDAPSQSSDLRDHAVSRLLEIICRYQNRVKVKPALQALAHFISKELISIDHLVNLHRNFSGDGTDSTGGLSAFQLLLRQFLGWVRHHDTAPAAGQLITNFLTKVNQRRICAEEETSVLPMWIKPLEISIRDSPEAIEEFKHHAFPEIFRFSFDDYLRFLYHLRLDHHLGIKPPLHSSNSSVFASNGHLEITLLFAALQIGKELGLVKDVDYGTCKTAEVREGALNVPDILFGRLLAHALPAVRLAALSLLVSSPSVTRPITKGTFQCLKRHLSHLHADTDANFRGELLSVMQRLFDRLRASTATLSKALANNRTSQKLIGTRGVVTGIGNEMSSCQIRDSLLCHTEFISWYLQFLSMELRPTSSYQRHISALKSLNFVLKSGLDPSIPHRSLSKQAQGDLKWEHQWDIFSPRLVRLLFDLMLDPFDDVRSGAALNLKMKFERQERDSAVVNIQVPTASAHSSSVLRPINFHHAELVNVVQFIGRAETIMLRTGRADHADGVARAYEYVFSQCAVALQSNMELQQIKESWWSTQLGVLFHLIEQLEGTIAIASENLSTAVNGHPVHGIFANFRYIVDLPKFYPSLDALSREELQPWKNIHRRIFVCLESIWSCVKDVLCNDAPEGHIPEDLEDEPEINTKDILSYSWRALKEASALLRAVISKAPVCTSSRHSILEPSDFKVLGKLCFVQLAELRHRGAFSTVSQTFAACCSRCISTDDILIQELPDFWYQDTLLCIRNKASTITRRSAGIPSLISGIISAEPGGRLFRKALGDLFLEASPDAESSNIQDSRLPQVHAMNCLKEIFTTTKLGQSSESYIGQGLDLAASKLGSKNWPIRNCGLMLFKALLDRLLGSSDTQKWEEQKPTKISRLSYGNYPNLLEIMAKLLVPRDAGGRSVVEARTEISSSIIRATEGVFPALQILQQAPPPAANRETIRALVLDLTRSPHWHVRDMAARTFASGLHPTEHVRVIRSMLSSLNKRQNSFHGLLLCVKYALRMHIKSSHGSTTSDCDIMEDLLGRFEDLFEQNTCPLTKATYLDLINSFRRAMILQRTDSSRLSEKFDKIARQLTTGIRTHFETLPYSKHSSVAAASDLLQRSISYYLVMNYILVDTANLTIGEVTSDELGMLQSILYELGEVDPDNCCAILEELREMFDHAPSDAVMIPNLKILASIYRLSLTAKDQEVRSIAQSTLSGLISKDEVRYTFFAGIDEYSAAQTFESLKIQCLSGSPSSMESAIRLQGFFLDHQLQLLQFWNTRLLHDQDQYIHMLQKSLHESNSFPTRHAAMLSIFGIRYIWTMENKSVTMPSPLLGFSLVVYDALNDDDNEIRELAAQVATKAIMGKRYRQGMRDAIPLLASQRLAESLTRDYSGSLELCEGALCRFMGYDQNSVLFELSFRETLARARKEDTALFIQEKQNLFIDGTREAVIWSRVLKRLSSRAIPRTLAQDFTIWVIDGIDVLTATANIEKDGPLGWTSKAEVFVLGMRVIYGAEVLLSWGMRSRKVGAKGSEIRRKLREFANVGRSGIHELWIDRIETVLTQSVLERLALVKERMETALTEFRTLRSG